MCLYEVNFAMEYDTRGKFYYGKGWKAYRKDMDGKIETFSDTPLPRVKRWVEMNRNLVDTIISDKVIKTKEDGYPEYNKYIPGFHIFLNLEDAEKYFSSYANKVVVPVLFKDVLAYGTNTINSDYHKYSMDLSQRYKPCVIARYIKVLSYV